MECVYGVKDRRFQRGEGNRLVLLIACLSPKSCRTSKTDGICEWLRFLVPILAAMAATNLTLVTQDDLVEKLKGLRGAHIVSVVTRTEPKMRKRDNPFVENGVWYLASRVGIIGVDYGSSVNRQRQREGSVIDRKGEVAEFKAESLWKGKGVRICDKVTTHADKGGFYLPFFPRSVSDTRFEDSDGNLISEKKLEPFLYSKPKVEHTSQGTDKQVHWRIFSFDSLLNIKVQKEVHWLLREGEAKAAATRRILGKAA